VQHNRLQVFQDLQTRPVTRSVANGRRNNDGHCIRYGVSVAALVVAISGCAPTVKVEAPDKPIEITMNVNINHEIRVKVDKDIEELVEENPDLY